MGGTLFMLSSLSVVPERGTFNGRRNQRTPIIECQRRAISGENRRIGTEQTDNDARQRTDRGHAL